MTKAAQLRCYWVWVSHAGLVYRPLFFCAQETYGEEAQKWWVYWRLFYLACSELFNYSNGEEWGVAHYLFEKKDCSVIAK